MNNDVRTNELENATAEELARAIVKILIEKKGIDVTLFDVREKTAVTDFYVNVTGRSSTHVSSLADEVDYLIGLKGKSSSRIEGRQGNSWILVDYLDVIVNVFDREARDFYNFERLMPEGSKVDISDIVKEVDEKFGN